MSRTDLHRYVKLILEKSLEPVSRRKVVSTGLATGALYTLPACVRTQLEEIPSEISGLPSEGPFVPIIGAGLAGLTCAYDLSKAGVSVQVFEGSDRVGGRAYTQYEFNEEEMFVERGGELVDTGHEAIRGLMTELGIPSQPLAGPKDRPKELFFFGNRYRSEKEIVKAFAPLAKRIAHDQKAIMEKGEIFVPTYKNADNEAIRKLDKTTLADYLESCRSEVEPWLLDMVRIAYVCEYGLEADQQSCLNLLVLIDPKTKDGLHIYGESDEAFRIQGGTSRLVEALEAALDKRGVTIHKGYKLTAIADDKKEIRLSFDTETGPRNIVSTKAVLAIPFSILRSIQGLDALALTSRKKQAIKDWTYGSNAKLMLGFKERYWQKKQAAFPASEGNVFSDTMLQQVWDTSRQQPGKSGILTVFWGGRSGKTVDQAQVQNAGKELNRLFPGISEQSDNNRLLQVWSAVSWNLGSYSCQGPGQYTTLMGAAGETELDGRLFFAGEHCSIDYSGYLNGAVESGKIAAAEIFKDSKSTEALPQKSKATK